MKLEELIRRYAEAAQPRLSRDAFLYYSPTVLDHTFAQCARCWMWDAKQNRCAILGSGVLVTGDMSCGEFVPGKPGEDIQLHQDLSPKDVGLVRRPVRCENCRFFNPTASTCGLFEDLNQRMPEKWNLDTKVDAQGCCNAQMPV